MGSRRACVLALFLSFALLRSVCAQAPEKPSGSSSSRQAHPAAKLPKQPAHGDSPDLGSIHEGVYRNVAFGISYKIPYGWVQRTDSMREGNASQPEKSYVLLAIFERPPEATGDSVNSAAVITAENLSEYPGMDQAGAPVGSAT